MQPVTAVISLVMLLALCWLVWSGMWSYPFLMGCGVVSILLVLAATRWLGLQDREAHAGQLGPRFWLYALWLLKEMFVSSIRVIGRVLSIQGAISPTFGWVVSRVRHPFGHAVYANSITLTPGTVTVALEKTPTLNQTENETRLYIHALEHASLSDLRQGHMQAMQKRLTGDAS